MINHSYEIIIVGSGATGGVAALTFAQRGKRVLVVETGPKLSMTKALGSEPLNTFRRLVIRDIIESALEKSNTKTQISQQIPVGIYETSQVQLSSVIPLGLIEAQIPQVF